MTDSTERAGLRVLVCGGRDYENDDAVWCALNAFCGDLGDETPHEAGDVTLIHAGGPGRLSRQIAEWADCDWCQAVELDPALALTSLRLDRVLAFPGFDADLLSRARAAGIPVNEVGGGDV